MWQWQCSWIVSFSVSGHSATFSWITVGKSNLFIYWVFHHFVFFTCENFILLNLNIDTMPANKCDYACDHAWLYIFIGPRRRCIGWGDAFYWCTEVRTLYDSRWVCPNCPLDLLLFSTVQYPESILTLTSYDVTCWYPHAPGNLHSALIILGLMFWFFIFHTWLTHFPFSHLIRPL